MPSIKPFSKENKNKSIVLILVVALGMAIVGFFISASFSSVADLSASAPAATPLTQTQGQVAGPLATTTAPAGTTQTSGSAGVHAGGAESSSSQSGFRTPTSTPHVKGPSGPPPHY